MLWGCRLVNNRRLLFYAWKSGDVATYGNKWALYATVEQLLRTNLSTEMSTQQTVLTWEYFSVKHIHPRIFKRVSAYSIPLIPNNLAWWVVNASDRTIIAHFLGTAANGIYSIANKFPNVFIQFYNILNLSWTETVCRHQRRPSGWILTGKASQGSSPGKHRYSFPACLHSEC